MQDNGSSTMGSANNDTIINNISEITSTEKFLTEKVTFFQNKPMTAQIRENSNKSEKFSEGKNKERWEKGQKSGKFWSNIQEMFSEGMA